MRIDIEHIEGIPIATVFSDKIEICSAQEALDLLMNCSYQGADGMLVYEHNFSPDFFNLKTGLAGDILQKFSTYNMRLAIIGDFSNYSSKSLKDFISESNKVGHILFVDSIEIAKQHLIKNIKRML